MKILSSWFLAGRRQRWKPFVTADVKRVAEELRSAILKSYYSHLKFIRRRLSFRGVSEVLTQLSEELYAAIFDGKYYGRRYFKKTDEAEKY
jgi:phosphoenolpyruvate carboxylase